MKKSEKAKFIYDFDTDTYSIIPYQRDYHTSFQSGDFIFDIDDKNAINGLEILNASKVFNLPRLILRNQINGRLVLEVTKDSIKLHLTIKSAIRNSQKVSTLVVEKISPEFLAPSELNLAVA